MPSLTRAGRRDILQEEMHTVMGLMGVTSLDGLTEDMIDFDAPAVTGDGDWIKAAFPLLENYVGNF